MYALTILLAAILSLTTSALPSLLPRQDQSSPLTNFLLVTTTQCASTNSSSILANVSATSLFDPYDQTNYLLRLIGPGYGSLPTFNLTSGDLSSVAYGPEGVGTYVYNSTGVVEAGDELMFAPQAEGQGNLGLFDGYLLAVGGSEVGWTVCEGPLGEQIIVWQGSDASCSPVFVHAVLDAPY